ncbi:hypothetical protein FACS1894105_01160 [Clostridia bacterium]|nr:hypothetical protein FACS1894105_01160 [Clostridia bacterium]
MLLLTIVGAGCTRITLEMPDTEAGIKLYETIQTAYIYLPVSSEIDDKDTAAAFKNKLKEAETAISLNQATDFETEIITLALAKLIDEVHVAYFGDFTAKYMRVSAEPLIESLSILDADCAYDSGTRTFYRSLGSGNTKKIPRRFITKTDNGYVYSELTGSDKPGFDAYDFMFVPELNYSYELTERTKDKISSHYVVFTVLPIIEISADDDIGEVYEDCRISVSDPNGGDFESSALIHIRGGASLYRPKRNYTLKFVTEYNSNRDVSLFGMRDDSDWILDAMYLDAGRCRDRVTTDIWRAIDEPLYYADTMKEPQTNGINGVFVEVFLNDEYVGLYHFTEKIDRKQLQLMKTTPGDTQVRSVIYKGEMWDSPTLFRGYYNYDNATPFWGGFEQKYPNPDKGGAINFKPLADFVDFAINTTDETFKSGILDLIDVKNFVNYTLLMSLSYAYDNRGKNIYWSVYDVTDEEKSAIFLTPWDLDCTWGRLWDSSELRATYEWLPVTDGILDDVPLLPDGSYDLDNYTRAPDYIFLRLYNTNAGGFADMVKERWFELRKTEFSSETLKKRFDDCFDLLESSGAWGREAAKWSECNLNAENEREYIKSWLDRRLVYLDGIFGSSNS